MGIVAYIMIMVMLLVLSGFFSGSETAIFNLKSHRDEIPDGISRMMKNPRKLLVSLLTGNTLVNVLMAALAAMLVTDLAVDYALPHYVLILMEVIIVTIAVLIFGEIIPKIIAIRRSEDFVRVISGPLRFFVFILYPLAFVLYEIIHFFIRIMPVEKEKIFDSDEELKILTQVGEEQGTLQSEESDMIQSIYEFHGKSVHEVMTPRVDMVALSSKSSMQDVIDLIRDKQFSKIPVYKDNIDDIRGILFAKDLIPFLSGSHPNVHLTALARQSYFVPESKELDELLDNFRQKKTSIAIVVDEWGGTSGLITLEDVVEEVIGELIDPFDKEDIQMDKQEDGSYIVGARVGIYDLEEEMEIKFPEERDYDTVGGFIIEELRDFPKIGDSVSFNDMVFSVTHLKGTNIDTIHIVKVDRSRGKEISDSGNGDE